jgi:hypothetical protein
VRFVRGRAFVCGAIWVQRLGVNSFVQTICSAFVQQTSLLKTLSSVEEIVELFEGTFEHTCALKEAQLFLHI